MPASLITPASRSRVRVSQVVESTRGTTPTNPAWKVVPQLENTSFDEQKTYERSAEIKSNRMGGRQVGGNKQAMGTLAVPLKNDASIRELIESAFSTTLALPTLSGANLAYVANGAYADADAVFDSQPADGDTITINGVLFTFKTTPTEENHIELGADLAATVADLVATLNASTEDAVAEATYEDVSSTTLRIRYDTVGTVGNAFTGVWSFASATLNFDGGGAATSGSDTLSGGSGTVGDQITDSGNRFRSTGFVAGMTVTTASSTTAGNDGTYVIKAVSSDGGTITLDREVTTAEAFAGGTSITAAAGDWFGAAGSARKFFSHEVAYLDLSPVIYEYYRGMEVNELSVEIPTSGEVTAEFSMVGIDSDNTEVQFPIGSGAYTAVADVVPFAGSIEGASLERDGVSSNDVENMSLSISNNREAKFAIGAETASHIEQGDFEAEIQASIYFTSRSMRQKYIAGTRFRLVVKLKDQKDGHIMVIEFPNVVITAAPKGSSGQSVVENVSFYAEEDAALGTKAMVWFLTA